MQLAEETNVTTEMYFYAALEESTQVTGYNNLAGRLPVQSYWGVCNTYSYAMNIQATASL